MARQGGSRVGANRRGVPAARQRRMQGAPAAPKEGRPGHRGWKWSPVKGERHPGAQARAEAKRARRRERNLRAGS